jgi:DNA-3-methyladenine glycosylase
MNKTNSKKLHQAALDLEFFQQSTLELAPQLLGKILTHQTNEGVAAGRIVEVEAYLGSEDAASHAARGPTPRSKIMFGPGGRAYVYFTYGAHHCVNVVSGADGVAGAVLIRALEPLEGLELMARRRGKNHTLCSGPGRLTQALGITLAQNGLWLNGSALTICNAASHNPTITIKSGPRIGISKAKDFPFRFWTQNNPHVSK